MSQSIDEVLLGTPVRGGGADGAGGDEEGERDKFVRQLFESLLLGTRASNAIPDGEGQEVCVCDVRVFFLFFFACICLCDLLYLTSVCVCVSCVFVYGSGGYVFGSDFV